MKKDDAITGFGALAHETRLEILRLLVRAGDDGMSAGAISDALSAAPSRVSFHLNDLSKAGLASFERHSRQVIYRANYQAIGSLIRYLLEDCCGGSREIKACCNL